MKLNILSDLHLGFGAMDGPVNDADVVVLAGDVGRPREAIAWALRLDKPVLYVPGNHEFYGGIDGTAGVAAAFSRRARRCRCSTSTGAHRRRALSRRHLPDRLRTVRRAAATRRGAPKRSADARLQPHPAPASRRPNCSRPTMRRRS